MPKPSPAVLAVRLESLSRVLFTEQRPMAAQACQEAAALIMREIVDKEEKPRVETR